MPAIGGASSETWLVDAVTGTDEHAVRWVLRIEPQSHQIYQDPSVHRQYRVIEALHAQTTLPVPAPVAFEADPDVIGAPFFLMERADGMAPPNDYHRDGIFADAAPDRRNAMWVGAIQLLARLNVIPTGQFDFLATPGMQAATDGIEQELMRWSAYRNWAAIPQLPLYDSVWQWLQNNRPAPVSPGFAWGDARPCNMLFSRETCSALLDWETASLGGGESDLGWWLFYDRMISKTAGIKRLDGMPDAATTIAIWEDAAGRPARAMDWHLVFAGYRFALISERARALAIEAGKLPPDAWGEANPAVRLLHEIADG
ncbi:MAG: phosphotransferase family protein [Blastomonas sp.]